MAAASLIFWILCGLPLIGLIYWLIRKDKNKFAGSIGMIILFLLIVAGVLMILYKTNDFNAMFSEDFSR
ncbi:putative membrane protein [Pedobacter sp. UYP30]